MGLHRRGVRDLVLQVRVGGWRPRRRPPKCGFAQPGCAPFGSPGAGSLGCVDEFLHERNVVLADEAKSVLLDALEDDFLPALATLRRRADGNYERDRRPEKFPAIDPSIARPVAADGVKPSGLTAWAAFELWIAERKPAASSVNRWRAVFSDLRETFGDRDLASISANEAEGWIDGPNDRGQVRPCRQ